MSFELSSPETIELTVYDIAGRQVARLENAMLPSGTHTIQFDAGDLASGIYMIRLSSEQTTLVRTMRLIK
ncbi:MAG: T9SS type A sorting domain-containing protein [Balneolales bacterium]|nr:T9SS type A sorting domain-containing protein [Balneolales bacterium]